ncbi:MAG: hypothetical protein JJE51_06865 [Thermoanaerobaculia bacterium]|nr:hypothetical protein [Thermoanaerobaculia bacterium]
MRVSSTFIVLFLLVGSFPLQADDVVVMRDRSERSGKLEQCADDQCRLSGKRIAMVEIRAIFFDGPRKELPVRSNAIVMRDGSVRTGRVTFINRGTVDTDDVEIDRSRVAAVVFSDASDKPLSDLLILRDGTVKSGALTTCNAASCTLDGAITPFANIEWVGLAREDVVPPSSSADEVHKIDGSIVAGRLSAINESRVSTTRGPVARSETAWVHLIAAAPAPPDQPGAFGAPGQQPPSTQPPVRPPVQPPPPPPTTQPPSATQPPPRSGGGAAGRWPPTPPPAGAPARRGALWTGRLQARAYGTSSGIYNRWDIDARLKLREMISPLGFGIGGAFRTIGSYIVLMPEGTVVNESVICRGKDISCRGQGTFSGTDTECAWIWLKNVDVDTTSLYQYNVPREGMYSVCIGIPSDATFDVTYRTPQDTNTEKIGFISPVIGHQPPLPEMHYMDSQIRTFAGGAAKMQGSFSKPASAETSLALDVSWSICREGVQCSDPAPLPPEGGTNDPNVPAGDDTNDDCVNLQRLIDGMRALREAYEAHEASFIEAERNRDAARDSIYGFSGTLSKFSLSLGSLALEAVSGAWGDLLGLIAAGAGMAQENNADNQLQAVLGIADTSIPFTPAESAGVRNAVKKADEYLALTGDDQGALRVFSGELGRSEAAVSKGQKAVKGISIVVSIADYAEKTNGLADSIQNYADYYREANGHKANMEDTQERMADKQMEIDELRPRLDGPCPGIPSTNFGPRRYEAIRNSPYRLVQSTTAAAEPPVSADQVRAVGNASSGVEAKVGRAMPWLLPFFARVTDGISPRLLNALLRKAEPDLRAVKAEVDAAVRAGRDVENKFAPGSTGAGG